MLPQGTGLQCLHSSSDVDDSVTVNESAGFGIGPNVWWIACCLQFERRHNTSPEWSTMPCYDCWQKVNSQSKLVKAKPQLPAEFRTGSPRLNKQNLNLTSKREREGRRLWPCRKSVARDDTVYRLNKNSVCPGLILRPVKTIFVRACNVLRWLHLNVLLGFCPF